MNDTVGSESSGHGSPGPRWRKSSFSIVGECVELADCGGGIGVRDSKQRDAGTLLITRTQLAGVVASIKAGDLDSFLA